MMARASTLMDNLNGAYNVNQNCSRWLELMSDIDSNTNLIITSMLLPYFEQGMSLNGLCRARVFGGLELALVIVGGLSESDLVSELPDSLSDDEADNCFEYLDTLEFMSSLWLRLFLTRKRVLIPPSLICSVSVACECPLVKHWRLFTCDSWNPLEAPFVVTPLITPRKRGILSLLYAYWSNFVRYIIIIIILSQSLLLIEYIDRYTLQ